MKTYILTAALLFVCVLTPFSVLKAYSGTRSGIEVDTGYDDNRIIWVGPGLYYGIRFENDYDYYNWRRHHRRSYHHPRHHGGHHGGHHGRQHRR